MKLLKWLWQGSAILGIVIVLGVFFWVVIESMGNPTDFTKLDLCIDRANQAGLDINDTEQRSNFIQNCYEN